MPFSLERVDAMIEVCQKHLANTGAAGTAVEAYLTQQFLILFSAEIEQEIERILSQKAREQCSGEFSSYVQASLSQVFRSTKTSDIAGLLGKFGAEYRARFQDLLDPRAETAYNNLIVNRHQVAHDSGSNLTFSEAVDSYRKGMSVLECLTAAIQS